MSFTKPFPYQSVGVRMIKEFKGRALLADEMGLGKTLQVLLYLRKHCPPGPVVIVCPAHLKENWKREARTHVGLSSIILHKMKPPAGGIRRRNCLYIINYDILDGRGRGVNKGKNWVEELQELKPVAVVADECHAISNRTAKRSKAVMSLCRDVKRVIMVSGTPLTNVPAELFPALHILLPKRFPAFHPYAVKYCAPKRKPWGWEFKGATRLPELHRRLRKWCMIRRLKKDVLKELPSKSRYIVPITLEDKAMKEYDEAADNFLVWMQKTYPTKAKSAAMAAKLVQLGYLKRLASELKIPAMFAWIDSFLSETDEKLIVFGIHKKILAALHDRYRKQCVLVDGTVTGRDRQKAVDQFTHKEKTRLFLGNMKAAGTGWNGTVASTVLFVEFGWTPGDHTQAEDRPHRIGQKGNVKAYYLAAAGTIEEHLCEILQEKQQNLDHTLDGKVIDDGLNVYDQLIAKLTGNDDANQ